MKIMWFKNIKIIKKLKVTSVLFLKNNLIN